MCWLIALIFFPKTDIKSIVNAADLYNLFYPAKPVNKLENLMEKIKIGYPTHIPGIFDFVIFSYIMKIKIMILKKSVYEIIGDKFIDNDLYAVIFSNYIKMNNSNEYYILHKKTHLYIESSNNKIIRKLLKN